MGFCNEWAYGEIINQEVVHGGVYAILPNLRLAVATNGFNPFGNFSTTYSMWPVLVMLLNLLPWECVNPANCFMSLLIPGPKSLGKDFDVFLEPLIEELLQV